MTELSGGIALHSHPQLPSGPFSPATLKLFLLPTPEYSYHCTSAYDVLSTQSDLLGLAKNKIQLKKKNIQLKRAHSGHP